MKFPLPERPFPPLQLSRSQCARYERTAMAIIHETVDEFDDFVHRANRTVDPKVWKSVRTRENVTVYKKRELENMVLPEEASTVSSGRSAYNSSNSSSRQSTESVSAITQWTLPKLLGVGSIVGDFDDVMYGVISPDLDSIKVKTTYVDDELVDSDILYAIQRGTVEDPYRFLGIKWFVKSTPSGNIVRPRDLVFLEATGVYVNEAGDKYGYHVMHSVDLPECPNIDHMGFRRGKISSCFLFRPLPNRSVEVFMKSFFDVAGNLPDVVAIMSGVNGLIGFWKSVYSAERKKLAWVLRESRAAAARARTRGPSGAQQVVVCVDGNGRQCCALCEQKFTALRSSVACELCRATVCSRCSTTRKLTYVVDGAVSKETMPFCKNCITKVIHMNAGEIARREHVSSAPQDIQKSAATPRRTLKNRSMSIPGPGGTTPTAKAKAFDGVMQVPGGATRSRAPTAANVQNSGSADVRVDALVVSRPRPVSNASSFQPVSAPASMPFPEQQELWLRMRELRMQAEQAYQLTAQNNHVMARATDGKAKR